MWRFQFIDMWEITICSYCRWDKIQLNSTSELSYCPMTPRKVPSELENLCPISWRWRPQPPRRPRWHMGVTCHYCTRCPYAAVMYDPATIANQRLRIWRPSAKKRRLFSVTEITPWHKVWWRCSIITERTTPRHGADLLARGLWNTAHDVATTLCYDNLVLECPSLDRSIGLSNAIKLFTPRPSFWRHHAGYEITLQPI